MSAGDVTLTETERERLWDVIARVRDGAPRVPGDADTHDIIDGIIDSGWVYDVLTARTPTATGESCPTCVKEGGPYRCCKCCPDDPGAHENGERDHHELPCTSCLVLIPTATGDDLRDRVTAALDEAVDPIHAQGCDYRHQQGDTDQCNSCTAYAVETALRAALAAPPAPVVSEDDDLRYRVAALADDDDLMFRMGCIEHDIENRDRISDSLRATVTRIAAEETRNLAAALAAPSALVVSRPEAVDGLDGFEYTLTRRALMQIQAQAWDEGAKKASPYGGGYLRSLYAENPYRAVSPASDSAAP